MEKEITPFGQVFTGINIVCVCVCVCVQEEKKEIAAMKAADRALLDKCSLDIELVPEEEEDQRLAGLIKYSVTKCKTDMTPAHRMSGFPLIGVVCIRSTLFRNHYLSSTVFPRFQCCPPITLHLFWGL